MSKPEHRAAWLHQAGWGVFTHYMADTVAVGPSQASSDFRVAESGKADADGPKIITPEKWNEVVDGFDTERLARQLQKMGAGYYVITLGQNSGFYCSPNATYDRYVGIEPSKCSRRDLMADLYEALEPRGIALMAYLPSGAPDRDPVAVERLEWKRGAYRNREFQIKWENVIREWSDRWGKKLKGWWFDGCYFADVMYRDASPPNFESLAAAARSGNPGAIVAFNPGILDPVITLTEHEDYTAGEIADALKARCEGRFLERTQWHMLTYLGPTWFGGGAPPRYTAKQATEITRRVLANGGVVSWDVAITAKGRIPEAYASVLEAMNKSLQPTP